MWRQNGLHRRISGEDKRKREIDRKWTKRKQYRKGDSDTNQKENPERRKRA